MDKHKIREWIIYISMGIVVIWIILKSVGIIQTPFWLEYGVPVGSFIAASLTIYKDLIDKLHNLDKDVHSVKNDVSNLKIDIKEVKEKVKNIEIKISL